jgi:hypothetical protein
MRRVNSDNYSGAKNVYQHKNGKWYAKVTKNGKVYRSESFNHFDQARKAAGELRLTLRIL